MRRVDGGHDRDAEARAACRARPGAVAADEPLEQVGLPAALTGPVARGNVATVRRHLAALPPAAALLYRATLPAVIELAQAKGAADPADLLQMKALVS